MIRPKLDREWHTLRQVCHQSEYPDVVKSEKPDFVISHKDMKFGVEVTEFYQDQTSGNYANVPGYINNILANEPKIMKKDRGKLHKIHVSFDVAGGSVYSQPMVFREYLSPQKRLERLSEIIATKTREYEEYDVGKLDFVDLIIHDQGDLFGGEGGRMIWQHLVERSRKTIEHVPYKRIYICKKIGDFDDPIILISGSDF